MDEPMSFHRSYPRYYGHGGRNRHVTHPDLPALPQPTLQLVNRMQHQQKSAPEQPFMSNFITHYLPHPPMYQNPASMFQPSAVQTNTPPAIDSSKTQEHTPSSQTTVPLSQLLSLKQYKFAVPVEQGILNCILCDRKQSVTDWLDHYDSRKHREMERMIKSVRSGSKKRAYSKRSSRSRSRSRSRHYSRSRSRSRSRSPPRSLSKESNTKITEPATNPYLALVQQSPPAPLPVQPEIKFPPATLPIAESKSVVTRKPPPPPPRHLKTNLSKADIHPSILKNSNLGFSKLHSHTLVLPSSITIGKEQLALSANPLALVPVKDVKAVAAIISPTPTNLAPDIPLPPQEPSTVNPFVAAIQGSISFTTTAIAPNPELLLIQQKYLERVRSGEIYSMEELVNIHFDASYAGFRHVVFLDLDNWLNFWNRLPGPLPNHVFVWTFFGGSSRPMIPRLGAAAFQNAISNKQVAFTRALQARNAADMCLSAKAGELDALLPYHVPFTLVSGDRAIAELAIRFAKRTMRVISPHGKSDDQLYQLLITATTM